MTSEVSACIRVVAVGTVGAIIAHLKGQSMYSAAFDARACDDAGANGAECTLCEMRFKFCQGHFVYEPISVILFDAIGTVVLGAIMTLFFLGTQDGVKKLFSRRLMGTVAPVGLIYIFGDAAELVAVGLSSPVTVAVVAQSRMLMVALMRYWFLGRRQTASQWITLWSSVCLCIICLLLDPAKPSRRVGTIGKELLAIPLVLLKNCISCGGAVFSEYFLQHQEVKSMPLSLTQCHFKAASMASAFGLVWIQGSAPRMFATTWDRTHHYVMPAGAVTGSPRTPFFGGWNSVTLILGLTLVANNFLIGDTLRRLSSVCKYAAGAFTFALTYAISVMTGARPPNFAQATCCFGIAVLVLVYAVLPQHPGAKKEHSS